MVVWADLPLQGGQSRHQQLAAFQKPGQASLQRKGFWASWNTARPQITVSWGRGVRSGGCLNVRCGVRGAFLQRVGGGLGDRPDNVALSPVEAWASPGMGCSWLPGKADSTRWVSCWCFSVCSLKWSTGEGSCKL